METESWRKKGVIPTAEERSCIQIKSNECTKWKIPTFEEPVRNFISVRLLGVRLLSLYVTLDETLS